MRKSAASYRATFFSRRKGVNDVGHIRSKLITFAERSLS